MKSLRARTFYEHLPIRCASRVLSIWKMLIKQLAKQKTLICETFKALYVWVHTSRKIIWFETTTYLPYVKTSIIHLTNIYWVFTMTSHCSRHWGDSNLKTSLKNNLKIFLSSRGFYSSGWKQLRNKIKKMVSAMGKKKAGKKDRWRIVILHVGGPGRRYWEGDIWAKTREKLAALGEELPRQREGAVPRLWGEACLGSLWTQNETHMAGKVWPQEGVVGVRSEVTGAGAYRTCGVHAVWLYDSLPHPHPITGYPQHQSSSPSRIKPLGPSS